MNSWLEIVSHEDKPKKSSNNNNNSNSNNKQLCFVKNGIES